MEHSLSKVRIYSATEGKVRNPIKFGYNSIYLGPVPDSSLSLYIYVQ